MKRVVADTALNLQVMKDLLGNRAQRPRSGAGSSGRCKPRWACPSVGQSGSGAVRSTARYRSVRDPQTCPVSLWCSSSSSTAPRATTACISTCSPCSRRRASRSRRSYCRGKVGPHSAFIEQPPAEFRAAFSPERAAAPEPERFRNSSFISERRSGTRHAFIMLHESSPFDYGGPSGATQPINRSTSVQSTDTSQPIRLRAEWTAPNSVSYEASRCPSSAPAPPAAS